MTIATELADYTRADLLIKPPTLRAGHNRIIVEIVKAVCPHHPHAARADDSLISDDLYISLENIDGHTLIALSRALGFSESNEGVA